MSVWASYGAGSQPPPGTPELVIRRSPDGQYMALVGPDLEAEYYGPTYLSAHRWCMNQYGLTSSMMLAVWADYRKFYPPADENKYRRAGA